MSIFGETKDPAKRAAQKLQETEILLQQHAENAEYHEAMARMLGARSVRLEGLIETYASQMTKRAEKWRKEND